MQGISISIKISKANRKFLQNFYIYAESMYTRREQYFCVTVWDV